MPILNSTPKSIYILGTSELGITNTPIKIVDEEQLKLYFGTRGTLIDCYRKLRDITNQPDIYLVKCNGHHANAHCHIIHNNQVIFRGVEFKSTYATHKNNNAKLLITDEYLKIVCEDKTLHYDYSKFPNIHSLFKAINEDAENRVSPFYVSNYTLEEVGHPSKVFSSCNHPIISFSQGYDGLEDSKNQIYNAIERTLSLLIGSEIDVLLFADCYMDDTFLPNIDNLNYVFDHESFYVHQVTGQESVNDDNFAYIENDNTPQIKKNTEYLVNIETPTSEKILSYYSLMLRFCIKQISSGFITKGVLGFKPTKSKVSTRYYLYYRNHIDKFVTENTIDNKYLSLVSVTCGDIFYDVGGTIENHYIAYAGVLSSEEYNSNITNVDYGENIFIRGYPTKSEIKVLKDTGFSFLRFSPMTKKVHVVSGNTLSKGLLGCEYVIRTIQLLAKLVKKHFDQHLGEEVNIDTERKFHGTVKECFSELMELSCVFKYDYEFSTDLEGLTHIRCNLYFPGHINPLSYVVFLN